MQYCSEPYQVFKEEHHRQTEVLLTHLKRPELPESPSADDINQLKEEVEVSYGLFLFQLSLPVPYPSQTFFFWIYKNWCSIVCLYLRIATPESFGNALFALRDTDLAYHCCLYLQLSLGHLAPRYYAQCAMFFYLLVFYLFICNH